MFNIVISVAFNQFYCYKTIFYILFWKKKQPERIRNVGG